MQLEERFNGHVFSLSTEESATLRASRQLARFARLVEGKQEAGGQLTLWQRYSFADLPIELISHIYQLFVSDTAVAFTRRLFSSRLMLGEVLNWKRLGPAGATKRDHTRSCLWVRCLPCRGLQAACPPLAKPQRLETCRAFRSSKSFSRVSTASTWKKALSNLPPSACASPFVTP